MEHVYHYSDTVRLPWILDAGELRPTNNPMSGYPTPDFLWATTSDKGSPTATLANRKELYKAGIMLVVRFTLDTEDFSGWPALAIDHPDWTALHISILNRTGAEMGDDPRTWRCRIGALDKSRWVAIHLRSYSNPRWFELPAETVVRKNKDIREVEIPDLGNFASQRFKNAANQTAYLIKRR